MMCIFQDSLDCLCWVLFLLISVFELGVTRVLKEPIKDDLNSQLLPFYGQMDIADTG